MEVAEEDGSLDTHNEQDHESKHDEPKHVVHLSGPAGKSIIEVLLERIFTRCCLE